MKGNRITLSFLVDKMKAPSIIIDSFYNHWYRKYYDLSQSRIREILTNMFVWTKKLVNFYNKKFNKDFKVTADNNIILLNNDNIFEIHRSGHKYQNLRTIIKIAKEIVNNNLLNEFLEYLEKKDVLTIFDVYDIEEYVTIKTKDIINAMKVMNKNDMKIIMISTDYYNMFEHCKVRTIKFEDAWKEGLLKHINQYYIAKVGNKPVILAFKDKNIFVIYDSDILVKILMEHGRN